MLLRDYLRQNAVVWPEREAYVSATARLTWGEVADRVWRLAAALRDLGIRKGDVVASMSRDTHEMIETWFAAATVGAVRTAINPRFSRNAAAHILRDANVRVLIVQGGECAESVQQLRDECPDLEMVIGFGDHPFDDDYETVLSKHDPLAYHEWPEVFPADRAAISYTSGSTGLPKGVMAQHGAVVSALLNTWLQAGFQIDDVYLHCLPAAGTNILLAGGNVISGYKTVLMERFSAEKALELIAGESVTTTLFVPTMIIDVLDCPQFDPSAIASMRLLMYGAAPATPALIRRAMDAFGCALQQWYGSTEATGGWTTMLHHSDHVIAVNEAPEILSSVGRPMLHTELLIVGEDGQELPRGEVGVVSMRSETLMEGYLNLPDETAAVLKDGWLQMGDYGYLDDRGYLYVVDRKDFVIVSGGLNIYPTVVENALAEHPAVKEVCVVGIPDDRWGEAVCAVVVPGGSITVDELVDHCRERLSRYEVPKRIELVDGLPRGATGKVVKREVRDRFWSGASDR